jgi:hypothetical protein
MSNWLDVVKTVAPSLASALGGPLAGTATTALSDAIFGKAESTDVLEETIAKADPTTLAALKKAELDFQITLADLDIDLERIHAGDRADARKRETDVKDRTPAQLAWVILAALFTVIAVLAFVEIPPGSKETFVMLAGSLSTIAGMAATYFFGSSSGSELKTKMMARRTDG